MTYFLISAAGLSLQRLPHLVIAGQFHIVPLLNAAMIWLAPDHLSK
jgi:hypothetical protein